MAENVKINVYDKNFFKIAKSNKSISHFSYSFSQEKTGENLVELGSDQTSCHNPFNGGYYPVQLSFDEGNKVSKNCAILT